MEKTRAQKRRLKTLVECDEPSSNEDLLHRFGIKPCFVNVVNETFSKIKIAYSVTTEEQGVKLVYDLKQENSNTFSMRVKRRKLDNSAENGMQTNRKNKRPNTINSSNAVTPTFDLPTTNTDSFGLSMFRPQNTPEATTFMTSAVKPVVFNGHKRMKIVRKGNALLQHVENISIGDVILCKMRGFAEWPAFVTGIDGNLIAVEFFGDHSSHITTIRNLFKFAESHGQILANLRKRKTPLYQKSVKEAELMLGISAEHSLTLKASTL